MNNSWKVGQTTTESINMLRQKYISYISVSPKELR